ncbi:hypothetical protein SNE40_017874 [Patella caerulea]|uniref:G-protein coupled receptors family 1 profile domain-containing protein n=2 Tax=Patella caerulea TaxID=87958 RepID=A0AAN8JF93_PATCE
MFNQSVLVTSVTQIEAAMDNVTGDALVLGTNWTDASDFEPNVNTTPPPYYPAGYPSGYTWVHIICSSIVVTLIILLIVIGNFLVIWAIITDRNLKGTQNLFIASLAFADMFLGILVIPFSLANELMGYWFFGVIWCELWKAVDVLLCTASISSLCLISLDRYWSITRAMSYSRQRTPKRAAIMIMIVWFVSAAVCIPPLIGWKHPVKESDWPMCTLSDDVGYVFYSSIGSFYIPAFIMLFVYYKIYQAAKARARKTVKKPTGPQAITKTEAVMSVARTEPRLNNQVKTIETPKDEEDPDTLTPDSSDEINNQKDVTSCPQPLAITDMSKLLSTDSDSCEPVTRNIRVIHNNTCLGATTVTLLTSDNDTESSSEQTKALLGPHSRDTDTDGGNSTEPGNGKVQKFTIVDPKQNGSPNLLEKNKVKASRPGILPGITRHLFNVNRSKKKMNSEGSDTKPPEYFSADKHKRKIAKARERRATLVLGLVMAAFILCWGPFFTMYLVSSFCKDCIGYMVFTVFFWIGYCNSALNPIIYTVFNRDFKKAFQKIICGKKNNRRNR